MSQTFTKKLGFTSVRDQNAPLTIPIQGHDVGRLRAEDAGRLPPSRPPVGGSLHALAGFSATLTTMAFDHSSLRWLGISDLIAEPEGPSFISSTVAQRRLDRRYS